MPQNTIYPGMSGVFANDTASAAMASMTQYGTNRDHIMASETYERRLLEVLIERTRDGHLSLLPAHPPIPTHSGLVLTYTRPNAIGQAERLQEGVTPAGDQITAGTISGTLYQYGKTVFITDVATTILNYDL